MYTLKSIFYPLFLTGLLIVSLPLYSQGGKTAVTPPGSSTFRLYAGSLPAHSSGTNQKLKIEVFGGDWSAWDLGCTNYYISTREAFNIYMERHGGATSSYTLKIYERSTAAYPGTYYDFVIESIATVPASYTVKAEMVNNTATSDITYINVRIYDPVAEGGVDVTSRYGINPVYTTSKYGDIGIGTFNPKNKLDVNGTIRAKEVKIEVSNWADFVFEPDYTLPSLKELKEFVTTNKHLPEIPTSQEVKENGINMGDLNTKLLQKIEEMTLYIINLEEKVGRLEKLEERLDKLETGK